MTTAQAAVFAVNTVKEVKASMLENGIADAKFIYAACNKLSTELDLPLETVVTIFEKA